MAEAIQTLTIKVKYDGKQASSELQSLRGQIDAIDKATRGKGFQHLNNIANNLNAIGQAASSLTNVGSNFTAIAQSAEKLFNTFKAFNPRTYASNIKALSDSLASIGKSGGGINQLANGLTKLAKVASNPATSKNLQDLSKQIVSFATNVTNNISDSVLDRFSKLGAAMAGISSVGRKGLDAASMTGSMRAASSVFKDLAANMRKVITLGFQVAKMPFKMILNPIQNIGHGLMNMTAKFKSFLSGIGRIALYRAIRTGIKLVTSAVRDGVNNLYIWADMVGNSFKPTMDSLASSFLYLKNSVGAMVSPILDYVAPAFEVLINQIVDVLNIFNQVIATMTGATTWRKAIRSAASYSDNISGLGHDAEDAADAVKELKRTILGFDEINRLEDKTKTFEPKKNGKDATGLYGNQGAFSFTEMPIGQTALDIAKALKNAWEKADFTQIGDLIGTKIGNALLNVPWEEKIQPFVKKIAQSTGTLLNGMFDYNGKGGKAMWDGIAYTIYNALNTAMLGYVTFFDTVNWTGIGQGIGAALKRVVKGINWDWMSDALAAFPNAVIDAITGFNKEFTIDDFKTLGEHIGSTVSSALTKINWTGLFGNAFTLATNILAGLNAALTSFDWSGVKDAILTGIKNITPEQWSDLGRQIGEAAFNIVGFVANIADVLISALEAGKWKDLIKGIWNGIDSSVKNKYGSWAGAAKSLAGWLGKHIGTLSIVLSVLAGFSLVKGIGAALWSTVKGGLIGAGGTLKRGSWTGLISTISITAGIALMFSNWNGQSAKSKIAAAIGGGLVTAGIIAKATACTFTGSLLAFGIGAALTLSIKSLYDTAKECGITSKRFLSQLATHIIGLGIGFIAGGPIGAAIGLTIATVLTLAVEDIIPDTSSYGGGSQFQFGEGSFAGTAWKNKSGNTVTETRTTNYGASNTGVNTGVIKIQAEIDTSNSQTWWTAIKKAWDDIVKTNKVAKFFTEGIANQSSSWWSNVKSFWSSAINGKFAKKFNVEGITNQASNWWTNVKSYWSTAINGKTAKRFNIEGIVNQSSTWWSNVKSYWSTAINGKFAKKFNVEGIVNQAGTWWSNVKSYWSQKIQGQTASKFSVAGINDQSHSWWSNVKQYWSQRISGQTASKFSVAGINNNSWAWWSDVKSYWSTVINGQTASKFSIAGIRNHAAQWWRDVNGYWNEVTANSNLHASVSVNNASSAASAAWSTMQTYFNSHPLSVAVNAAVSTGTTTGGSITGALTSSNNKTTSSSSSSTFKASTGKTVTTSNGALNLGSDAINAFLKKKKATGGVFKDGAWHHITKFAAGGSPLSGQMFIAREAGPELVGNLGGNTAIMNNDQIVASVSAGVARAVASVIGGNSGQPIEVTVKVDSETLYRTVKKGERKASGRYGTAVAIG